MNDNGESILVPAWFRVASIGALLWEALGCVLYLMRVTTDPASLPVDQRAIFDATPAWVLAAFAVAVWVGLAGAILLVMRRRLAQPLLLASLAALVIQNSALVLDPALRNLVASDQLLVPFIILVVSYSVWHLAWQAQKSGWLR
jgi:hypothetical protein